jgi:hypothetical protein
VSDPPFTFTKGNEMTFGLKHNMTTGVTTAGKFDSTGLTYLGLLSSEKEIKWTSMTLSPGMYHMHTNGSEMFLFPEQ